MKHQHLLDLLKSPEFNRLALESVSQGSDPSTRWWDLHMACVEREVEMTIWTTAQYMKLLFETYPTEVKSIKLKVGTEVDDGEEEIKNDLYINERFCSDYYNEFEDLDPSFLEVLEERDDAKVFNDAIDVIGETATSHVLRLIDKIQAAFEHEFTSTAQIDAMLAEHAPFVRSWADAQLLAQVAKDNNNPDRIVSGPGGFTKL